MLGAVVGHALGAHGRPRNVRNGAGESVVEPAVRVRHGAAGVSMEPRG